MIKLKEALGEADKLTNKKLPSYSSIRRWVANDLLTGAKDYITNGKAGGRIGLYDDTLPVQIAVVAELKKDYTLAEIAKISKNIFPKFAQMGLINSDDFKEKIMNGEIIDLKKMKEEKEKAIKFFPDTGSITKDKIEQLEKEIKKYNEIKKKHQIIADIINKWALKLKEYENKKVNEITQKQKTQPMEGGG